MKFLFLSLRSPHARSLNGAKVLQENPSAGCVDSQAAVSRFGGIAASNLPAARSFQNGCSRSGSRSWNFQSLQSWRRRLRLAGIPEISTDRPPRSTVRRQIVIGLSPLGMQTVPRVKTTGALRYNLNLKIPFRLLPFRHHRSPRRLHRDPDARSPLLLKPCPVIPLIHRRR